MDKIVEKMLDKILERETVLYDHRRSNRLHDEIHALYKRLRDKNELKRLQPLLSHKNVNVVTVIAPYYYFENKIEALAALDRLKKRTGFDPFVVNDLINRLKNGEIKFDY